MDEKEKDKPIKTKSAPCPVVSRKYGKGRWKVVVKCPDGTTRSAIGDREHGLREEACFNCDS